MRIYYNSKTLTLYMILYYYVGKEQAFKHNIVYRQVNVVSCLETII